MEGVRQRKRERKGEERKKERKKKDKGFSEWDSGGELLEWGENMQNICYRDSVTAVLMGLKCSLLTRPI